MAKSEDLPAWTDALRGADRVQVTRTATTVEYTCRDAQKPKQVFQRTIWLPLDLEAWAEQIDPLIPLHVVAEVVETLQGKLRELVVLSRREGHSWTEIGQALGTSKQAAWQAHGKDERLRDSQD